MASGSKRQRDVDEGDGEEDEEVEIESASSSFCQNSQPKPSKIAKIARAHARGGAAPLSDTDENDGPNHYDDFLENGNGDDDADMESDLDAAAEYSLRHYSDYEEEDDEIDELEFTQVVRKHLGKERENMPMDEGIIEQVVCRNFMCHSWFSINLGPLINFIVGHNGSGKSAVLTALTMCLGGKATATNRGGSLKSLIKEGQESASLSVKIKNQGENAYKPELYGKSIVVERHFSRSGSSGFKIKNEKDKMVSTKKSDLDDILDFFSLQLDNPINVLTQDQARQFLSNSTPSDKYKFFIRGTNLETLDSDYNIFEEHLDGIIEKMRIRDEDVAHLAQKMKEAEERKKRGERTEHIYQRLREAQRQHAWAQVEEQERDLAKCNSDVQAQEEEVRRTEEEAETIGGRFEAAETAHEAAIRAFDQYKDLLGPVTDTHASEKEKFDHNTDLIKMAKAEQRHIRESIKNHKKEVSRLGREIELEQDRLADEGGAAHAQRLEDLKDLKSQAEEAKTSEQEHAARLPELEKACRTAEEYKNAANVERAETAKHHATAQAKLREFQRQQGGKFEPYPRNTKTLCEYIDKETRWRVKPVGPLGTAIQLLKPEWSSILERTFGGVLNAFAVTCKDDQNILNSLAKRAQCDNVTIYICSAAPIDTTGKEPDSDVDTILRVMRITEPAVRNLLIINQAIEQTVLIKDSSEASQYSSEHYPNVKATLAFGQGSRGIRYDYSRSGELRAGPIKAWEGNTRMKTDREEQLRARQQAVIDAQQDADTAVQRFRGLQREVEKANQEVERHRRTQKQLKTERQQREDAIEEMQNLIESQRPQDGRLQELQRQLEEAESEVKTASDSYQDSVENVVKLDDTAKELKTCLDAAQAELDQAQNRVAQAEAKKYQTEAKRHAVLLEKNAAYDNVTTARSHVDRLQHRRDGQQARVDEWTTQASNVSARVAVEEGVTIEMLDNRLERLQRQYEQETERAGGSSEELTRLFVEADREHRKAKNEKKEMDDLRKTLTESLKERRRRWGLFRKYISVRAKINFSYLLSERQFRGRVLLDHKNKQLDIAVEPDMSRKSDSGRQAKTLSGGEKSFSTICLLLSIWEAMGSPIRCLDEFDVFMDNVNRVQSMNLMIQTARRSVGRQFILITPQSMQNVPNSDDVKIHKMSDPERGQQSLNFNG